MAKESRPFLIRVVRYLAGEAGVRQFLDIGSGLPTLSNTHEVAQGVATYVHAEYHEPERITAEAAEVLDFSEPVAVMFMGVLGYVTELDVLRSIVARVMDAVPSGSHLVFWDGTNTSEAVIEGSRKLAESGAAPYILRSPEELASVFEGLEPVEPGLVQLTGWRPDTDAPVPLDAYGAVGREP